MIINQLALLVRMDRKIFKAYNLAKTIAS